MTITPTAKVQIVLGTNGSGKSSLLKMGMTAWLPSKDDFEIGGYRIYECQHNGHTYEMRFVRQKNVVEHHFIMDGEDLNPGMTGGTQRELLIEHFGMTQDLHDILTGDLRFTQMNNSQRREWIAKLSNADFDYVMQLYSRVKRALKGAKDIIGHQSNRLVEETAKKLDDKDIADLHDRSKTMRSSLSELYMELDTALTNSSFEKKRERLLLVNNRLSDAIDELLAMPTHPPALVVSPDVESLLEQESSLRTKRKMLETALHEVSDQYQMVDRQLHDISALTDIDPDALQADIDRIEASIKALEGAFKGDLHHCAAVKNTAAGVSATEDLIAALHGVPTDATEQFDRDAVRHNQAELQELQEKYRNGTGRISEIEYRLKHIAECHDICCPKCNHTFKEGVNPNEESELRTLLAKGMAFKSSMDKRIQESREYMDQAQAVQDAIYQVERFRDIHPYLSGLFQRITEAGGIARGRELIPVCRDFIHDCHKMAQIDKMHFDLAPMIEKLNQVRKLDRSGSLRDVHHHLTERIQAIQLEIHEVNRDLGIVERYRRTRSGFDTLYEAVQGMLEEQRESCRDIVAYTYNECIDTAVKKYQVALGMLETTLSEAEIQAGIVKDLNKSLDQAIADEKSLALLEKSLSPKDGLIAEQILVFVNTFIERMNEEVGKVWGYNLALDMCDLQEGELTYKFPMYTHNVENSIPDVKFGSDSQVDIVDQAFRLVVYQFLELHGYPLYLDELGRTFDAVHAMNLVPAIKDLMDDEMYSQVFLISHSFESQNSYPNSEIIVLDDSHVQLKRAYNEHVAFA